MRRVIRKPVFLAKSEADLSVGKRLKALPYLFHL